MMCSYILHQHVRKRFPTRVFLASLYCKINCKSRNTNAFKYHVLNLSPREGKCSLSQILTTKFIQFCTCGVLYSNSLLSQSKIYKHSCISPVIYCSASYSFGWLGHQAVIFLILSVRNTDYCTEYTEINICSCYINMQIKDTVMLLLI